MIYNDLLELWKRNKRFPHYAAERRIDIFINLFLENILAARFKKRTRFIAPEFPLRHGSSNRTIKVDYLCTLEFNGTTQPVFVELKTDVHSLSAKQINQYCAHANNWPGCVDNLKQIIDEGIMIFLYREKYAYLIKQLHEGGLLHLPDDKLFDLNNLLRLQLSTIKDRKEKSNYTKTFKDITEHIVAKGSEKAILLFIGPKELDQRITKSIKTEASNSRVILLDFDKIAKLPLPADMAYREEFEHLLNLLRVSDESMLSDHLPGGLE